MPRASGFALYRYDAGQWERQPDTGGFPLRPGGELIWLHVADPERFPLLNDLIARLKSNRDGMHIVLSFDENVQDQDPSELPPVDADCLIGWRNVQSGLARQFASHWQPDACLWIGGALHSALIVEVSNTGCLMLLADVDEADVQNVRRAWFPGRSTKVVDCFARIFVRDAATSRAVRRHGVDHRKISVAGALRGGAVAPPVFEDQLAWRLVSSARPETT